jgi:predicted DNA-binding transcriptional regulator YafY
MPKRPDTMETVHIALELLKRIPRDGMITAPQLHAQLKEAGIERDLRSIQRQMEMLTKHFDVECDDRNRPFGYQWKAGARGLSLQSLSAQESMLLTMAEQYLRNLLPTNLMKSMASFFEHARVRSVPSGQGDLEREWLAKVRVVSEIQPLLPPPIRKGVFEEVSQALYLNRWLEINYQNSGGKRTKAEIMPLGLAQQGPRIYLVCRFTGYDDERILALHRIQTATVTNMSFFRPKDFDIQKYDNDGHFGLGEGKRIKIKFRIDKQAGYHLLESKLSLDQTVREMKNCYEITATVVDSQALWRWIRSFGDSIEIR